MILIGSEAALLHGILPAWREGCTSGDVDLLATAAEAKALAARADAVWRSGASPYLLMRGRHFDVHEVSADFHDLAGHLSGRPERHFGEDMVVASPAVLWASLYLTAGLAPQTHEKSLKDFYHYDRLGLEIGTDHIRLALMFRDISLAGICPRYTQE